MNTLSFHNYSSPRRTVALNGGYNVKAPTKFFREIAQGQLESSRWYQTCPTPEKNTITLTCLGVEERSFPTIMAGTLTIPVMVWVAKHPNGDSLEIILRLGDI